MHFGIKSYLTNNHYHIVKHPKKKVGMVEEIQEEVSYG